MNFIPGSSPFLEVRGGALVGMSFPLVKQEVTIGRSEDNDITIPDSMVSHRHARITIRMEAVIIDDLDSTNGTIVNGNNIQSHILQEGDHILIGSTELAYHPGAFSDLGAASDEATSKKRFMTMPVLIGIIIAGLLLVAGLATTFFVLKGKEEAKDTTPPQVEIIRPAPSSRVEMGFAPGAAASIDIEVEASDEVELNKVDILINGEKVATFKSDEGPVFAHSYVVSRADTYAIKAVAYDAAGNETESSVASIEVWQDLEKKAQMEAYVAQVEPLIMEYRQYRQVFNQAYKRALSMSQFDPGWYEVAQTFLVVKENREKLLTQAGGFRPTSEFQAAQVSLSSMLSAAIQADTFAVQWAASGGTNTTAKGAIDTYSNTCQAHGASFSASYNQARAACLGMGPGTPPH